MANAVYNKAKQGFLDGSIDLDTATIKVALVRSYTYAASHQFVSDVTTAGGVIASTSAALGAKTVTDGVFDAADTSFTAVAQNGSGHGYLLFQSSAAAGGADVAATAQRVIAWYDTGTNLPVFPNGGDINVTWDNGTNRILRIA
jgi:hypothetical protein